MLYKLALKKPVTTIMLLLMVILAGIVALLGLNIDLMPKMDIPVAIVSTSYLGAGPHEIETLVSKPIESSLATISNIDKITTVSSDGYSMVVLQFIDGIDIDMAAVDVREKIDMVKAYLPADAKEPVVMKIDPNSMSGMYLGVSGSDDLVELKNILDDKIRKRLERIDGVASVSLMGGLDEIIEISLLPERLAGYGVSEAQIMSALKSENLNYPSGTLVQGDLKLQVRSVGEYKSIDDIKMLPIITPLGAVLRLDDLAVITKTTDEPTSAAIMNGEQTIVMTIQKQSTANSVSVSKKVSRELSKIRADYPNLKFDVFSDPAEYIQLAVSNVIFTLLLACLLAILVLFLFLRNTRASMIIGVSIPTSVIATFGLMYLADMTLNVISLGGLTIGIGMLVDNSIVVLESIFKKRENGLSSFDAALVGAKEVAMAVAASTATTCAVFIPMIFIKGTVGQVFKDLSYTICFSLIASLVVSVSFVPMACAGMMKHDELVKKRNKKLVISVFLDKWGVWVDSLEENYKKLLHWSLHHRKRVIFVTLAVFIATLSITPLLGASFMPKMDQGEIVITAEVPSGTRLEETVNICETLISKTNGIPEVKFAFAYAGTGELSMIMGSAADTATVYIMLVDLEERKRSADEVAEEIRGRVKGIAGAKFNVSTSQSAMGSYSSADISFQLNGIDTEELKKVGNDVVGLVSQIEGIREVKSSAGKSVPEANIVVDRSKAATYGVTAASVANAVNTAITGRVATSYKISGTEIDIKVRHNKDDIEYLSDIKNLKIPTPKGGNILLGEVASVTLNDGPASITRINQQECITIEANIADRKLDAIQKELKQKLDGYEMPDGYSYEFTGDIESMMESFKSLLIVLAVSILLVYMIIASQFESLLNPFIIMFSIPLALTGGLFSLFVTGTELNISGLMGFIMLVGVVVNNAIVLIDYTNQLRETGLGCYDALIVAGPARLRPILMTTLTTIIGLFPMAMASGSGTELTRDLSIVSIGGLTLSTFVTLIFIPVLYTVFENSRNKRREKKERRREKKNLLAADSGIQL